MRINSKDAGKVNRLGATKSAPSSTAESKREMTMNEKENKEIWKSNQIYVQTQLDMIHVYLVHSDWKYRVNRYINNNQNKEQKDDDEEDDFELEDVESMAVISDENKGKYVTNSYGFGVDHSHPHLNYIYASLHDELLYNKLHAIDESTFSNLLIKATKIHKIATTTYSDELI